MMRGIGSDRVVRFDALEDRVLFSTFTVTSINDSGAGTLRQAILDANANPGADTIDFAIGGDNKQIRPQSALPQITEDLTIDATTQSGYSSHPLVEINGKGAGADANGLNIKTGAVTVKGLAITSFSGAGIVIGSAGDCTIQQNYIGVDPTGRLARGNGQSGIIIAGSSHNMIGGTDAANANVIAYNGWNSSGLQYKYGGVLMYGSATGNSVLGNSIYGNQGIGIDLVRTGSTPDGVNLNNQSYTGTGTNLLPNRAVLNLVFSDATKTTITGTLTSRPNMDYRIEFFGNPRFSDVPTQGKAYYTTITVHTDATGSASFGITPSPASSAGLISATATDPDGNTSEFALAAVNYAGSIAGLVYNDANGDGIRQSTEGVLSGITVFDDSNNNGVLDSGEASTTTNSKGKYSLNDLYGGQHHVRLVVPSGYRLTSPAAFSYALTLPTTKPGGHNFGLTTTAIVRGSVFNDANGNAARDTGEKGMAGWTVYIDKNNNGKFDAGEKVRVTNSAGDYRFAGLTPGKYIIRVVAQTGFTGTVPTGGTQTLTLKAGMSRSNRLFGEQPIA